MESKSALTRTTTLSKTSALGLVWGLAEMADGTLVLSDAEKHTICTLSLPSSVNVIAGSGHAGFLDGVGDKAHFNTPKGLALNTEGEILVADSANHRLRVVSPNGVVTTLSGTGKRGNVDGPTKSATWDLPVEMAHIPSDQRILVASFTSSYLRCIVDNQVTTITPKGSSSHPKSPHLNLNALTPDLRSPIFGFVKENAAPPLTTTIAKLEQRLLEGPPVLLDGHLGEACFKSLNAMISNSRGDTIVMDCGNHAIRIITVEGRVSTLSGNGFPGHRDGSSSHTRLCFPRTMLLTKRGEILVADSGNLCLRRIELGASIRHLWTSVSTTSPIVPSNTTPTPSITPAPSSNSSSASSTSSHGSSSSPSAVTPQTNYFSVGKQRLLTYLMPTEGTLTPTNPPPLWSDLVWGTSHAGTWRLHRAILFSRCPPLGDPAIQSRFLDLRISVDAYLAFWEFVYSDVLPVPKADVASATLYVELLAIFETVKQQIAAEYTAWILSYAMDGLASLEELLAVIPLLVTLGLTESLKTAVRIITRRTDNPKTEDAMQQVSAMVQFLSDAEFQAWFKRRSSMTASFSKKLVDKPPPSPLGYMDRDFGALLVREESTGRIRFPDLVLKVQVDQLSCHRAILYKRWPLLTPYIEGSTMDKLPLVIPFPPELSDMRISSLFGLLWFFYTGSLEKLKETDDCTDLARIYDHLQVDDPRLRAHIFNHGFVDLSSPGNSPNLWVQPVEPPASSCSIQ